MLQKLPIKAPNETRQVHDVIADIPERSNEPAFDNDLIMQKDDIAELQMIHVKDAVEPFWPMI